MDDTPMSPMGRRPISGIGLVGVPSAWWRRARLLIGIVVVGLAMTTPVASATEKPIPSTSPDADGVSGSVVSFYAPLPDSDGAPAACDRLSYLRYREASQPNDPGRADAILVLMPGILEGAGSLDPIARNVVRRAAEQDYHVEVWAVDRRGNCLEDHTGLKAAAASGDPDLAGDYYLRGRSIRGKTFTTPTAAEAQILARLGIKQTLEDWRAVLDRVPASMRRRTFCGGHSLGGLETGLLARWDFDGDPSTTGDQGYRRCAGMVILDSRMELTGAQASAFLGVPSTLRPMLAGTTLLAGLDLTAAVGLLGRGLPYVPADKLLAGIGALSSAAAKGPRELSENLADLPTDPASSALLALVATDPTALGGPSLRDIKASNETALALLTDDNSSGVAYLRASLGGFTGGPVSKKNFPLPYGTPMIPSGLLGGRTVRPSDPRAVYEWISYGAVPASGLRTTDGATYTVPGEEVTDVRQFAKAFALADLDGSEWYFPTRLAVESVDAVNQLGTSPHLVQGNITKRPALFLDAEDGVGGNMPSPAGPGRDFTQVLLRGYDHVDVNTAAWSQASGDREPASDHTVEFMMKYRPAKADHSGVDDGGHGHGDGGAGNDSGHGHGDGAPADGGGHGSAGDGQGHGGDQGAASQGAADPSPADELPGAGSPIGLSGLLLALAAIVGGAAVLAWPRLRVKS